jgi:hypothetical protein
MSTKFTVQFEVELDDRQAVQAIELARRAFTTAGGASALVDGEEQPVPADQFITCIEQALLELLERNPLFDQVGLSVDAISCRSEGVPSESDQPELSSKDELDEGGSDTYICRWPNGDFSIVTASSKRDAIIALDEWDAASPEWLTPMDTCLIDFRLNRRGEIEFAQFGCETADFVWKTCYPVLDEVLTRRVGDRSRGAIQETREAVKRERNRLRGNQKPRSSARTEFGRELQRRLGVAGPTADHYVEQFASRLLRSGAGKKGKPS